MSDELTLDPTAELDLSQAGLQPTRVDWLITSTDFRKTKKGNGKMVVVEFEALEPVDEIPNFKATAWFVTEHDDSPGAAKGGLAKLRKLFLAALDKDVAAPSALDGVRVNAEVKEDDDGFRSIGLFRPVEVTEEVAAIEV